MRTSRNMAWYPPEYVERIRLIKRLQEERFLPLRLIKELLADRPQRTPRAAVDLPGQRARPARRARRAHARTPRATTPTTSP